MIYSAYIQSPEWKVKRLEALAFHGPHCAVCGSEHRLEVHHLTYERLGFELMSDLQILCKYHHEEAHNPFREQEKAARTEWLIAMEYIKRPSKHSCAKFNKKARKARKLAYKIAHTPEIFSRRERLANKLLRIQKQQLNAR